MYATGTSATSAATSTATGRETAMWLLEQLVPGSGVNNLNTGFRVSGALAADVLEETVHAMVQRHDVLRTVFHGSGDTLTKRVLAPDEAQPALVHRESSEETLGDDLKEFVAEPFAVEEGQLLVRAGLFQLGGAQAVCLVAHHLIVDAMSMSTLRDQLVHGYERLLSGATLPVDPVPALPEPEPAPELVDFWRSQLDGYVPAESSLWLARRENGQPTLTGDAVQRDLSEEARQAVARLRRELRAPDSVILLAAYYLLLSLHGAGEDLIVGSPVSTRPHEALSAVGYHVNLLPLRMRVEPSGGFRALVRATRAAFLKSMEHATVPAELLVERGERTWRSPLFRYLFNYVPYLPGADAGVDFTIGGLDARQLVELENGFSRFDLEFFVPPLPPDERIRIRAVFRDQVFTRDDVELLLSRYDELIVAVAADLDRPVEGWPPPERPYAQEPAPAPAEAADAGPDWLVEELLGHWRELLGSADVDADSHFFSSGGNSLKGAQLVSRVKKSVRVPLKLADLFANPTPNTLAARLSELRTS